MIKRALLLIVPLLLAGCSVTEVRERSFIQTASVYRDNEEQVALLPFDADTPVTASGKTLLSALETAEGKLGSALFLGHAELLAVGRGTLTGWLETLLDGNRISPSCKLFYAPDGTVDPAVIQILSQMTERGQLISPGCGDGLRHLLGRAKKTVLPVMDVETLTLAVVDDTGKRLGLLDADACRGLFWLTGGSTELTLPVDTADGAAEFSVRKTCAKLTAVPQQDGLTLQIQLEITGDEAPEAVISAVKEEAKRLCEAAVQQTVSDCGADVIGIEEAVERADRSYYLAHAADWDAVLKTASISVIVSIRTI